MAQNAVFHRYLNSHFGVAPRPALLLVALAAAGAWAASAISRLTGVAGLYGLVLVAGILTTLLLPARTAFATAYRVARYVIDGRLAHLQTTPLRRSDVLRLFSRATFDDVEVQGLMAAGLIIGLWGDLFFPVLGPIPSPLFRAGVLLVVWLLSLLALGGFVLVAHWVAVLMALHWPQPALIAGIASGFGLLVTVLFPIGVVLSLGLLVCLAPIVPLAVWPTAEVLRQAALGHKRLAGFPL